jgi:hypothetical protein
MHRAGRFALTRGRKIQKENKAGPVSGDFRRLTGLACNPVRMEAASYAAVDSAMASVVAVTFGS